MSTEPSADDILRAVAYIQGGHQIIQATPADRWYETTEGAENPTEVLTEYEADSYAAGWDTAAYAAGNPDVDAHSPEVYDMSEYALGMIAGLHASQEAHQ